MAPSIEKISAVTFRVMNMTQSVRFYRDVLGMELLYGGERSAFSSLRAGDAQSAILNLEQGGPVTSWGRVIFYVTDVDALCNHLKDRGFDPEIPRDAPWGERYFHMPDPDGHELSFALPYEARRMNVVKRPVADTAPESEGDLPFLESSLSSSREGTV